VTVRFKVRPLRARSGRPVSALREERTLINWVTSSDLTKYCEGHFAGARTNIQAKPNSLEIVFSNRPFHISARLSE
jgi:hypothetical protein